MKKTPAVLAAVLLAAAILIGLMRGSSGDFKPASDDGSPVDAAEQARASGPEWDKNRDGAAPAKRSRAKGRQLDPKDPLNRVMLGNFEWARETVRKGEAAPLVIADAHKGLGLMFIREEKWAEAEKHIRESIRLGMDDAENQKNLAQALARKP